MAGIEVDGFDELEEMLRGMEVTEADEKKAMKAAIEPVYNEVLQNTPERSGRLKKSLKKTVKKEDLATVGIVRFGVFWDKFNEYGTSKEKKHVGFFAKAVNDTQGEAVNTLANELLSKVK